MEWIIGLTGSILAILPTSSEFWSGIIGAVVGGGISYFGQLRALQETRKQRREDHLRIQQALANTLLFKLIRIHSDFYTIHRHVEDSFEHAAKTQLTGEPWQFVRPLANFPAPVNFSPDEMGMLLGLKSNDVFNKVVNLDVVHNSLVDASKIMSVERQTLTERLKHDNANGNVLSSTLDQESYFSLKPKMIEVNSLIGSIRDDAERDVASSLDAMQSLHTLLKSRLGLTYQIESTISASKRAT